MSASFLLSEALASSFKRPYQDGDSDATVRALRCKQDIGPVRVMLKQNFDTACWIPPAGTMKVHSIYYGTLLMERGLEKFLAEKGLSSRREVQTWLSSRKAHNRQVQLDVLATWLNSILAAESREELYQLVRLSIAKYGRHERCHALRTPRDLQAINKLCAKNGVSFRGYNLFEDARIEHFDRLETKENFDWLAIEEIAGMESPLSLFFRRVQLDGAEDVEALANVSLMADSTGVPSEYTVQAIAQRVSTYYNRVCACEYSTDLIAILREFMEEFAVYIRTVPYEPDLQYAASAIENGDKFFESFDKDADEVSKSPQPSNTFGSEGKTAVFGSEGKTAVESGHIDEASLLGEQVVLSPTDAARIAEMEAKLVKLFEGRQTKVVSESPSRRISTRHLVRGELKYVHNARVGGKKPRKWGFVLDLSGSMSVQVNGEQPLHQFRLLLIVLNRLANRGFLHGYVLLSQVQGYKAGWVRYAFPMSENTLLRIEATGMGEGLQTTLAENSSLLAKMDDVFVGTDARITDDPINHRRMRMYGITPVGLYAGDSDSAKSMSIHFPQNIVKDTIEEIVDVMLDRKSVV